MATAGGCSSKPDMINVHLSKVFSKEYIKTIRKQHPKLNLQMVRDILSLINVEKEKTQREIFSEFTILASIRSGYRDK